MMIKQLYTAGADLMECKSTQNDTGVNTYEARSIVVSPGVNDNSSGEIKIHLLDTTSSQLF
jgi:hypothetical protein